MSDLIQKTAAELSAALASKAVSAVEVAQAFIDRTEAVEDRVKAFNSRDAEWTLAQAKASDERRKAKECHGPPGRHSRRPQGHPRGQGTSR